MQYIFDVDGVVINTSQRASILAVEKFNLNPESIQSFFKNKWHDCVEGRSCIKELLKNELPLWGFSGTVDEYLDFWFRTESKIDHSVLQIVDQLRQQGYQCHLGTNQEKFRADHLWNDLKLCQRFDRIFYSADLGATKPNEAFYSTIESALNCKPSELVLIDDTYGNIEAAKKRGWRGVLYPQDLAGREILSLFRAV